MMSSHSRKSEINVFLKCQNCGTFITSPSFPAIKKHYNECRQRQLKTDGSTSTAKLPEDNDESRFDMECDFIDEEMETVTLSQPFLILKRCNLESSVEVKPVEDPACQLQVNEDGSCDIIDNSISVPVLRKDVKGKKRKNKSLYGYIKKRNKKRRSVSAPLLSNQDLEISSASTINEIDSNQSLDEASKPTLRKSRLKALVKLNEVMESEKNDEDVDLNDDDNDDEWEMKVEPKPCVRLPKMGKECKTKSRKLPLNVIESAVYDNPKYPFKCDVCTTRFRSEDRLTWHKENVHANKDGVIFSCSICGRMLNKRLCFQSHLKRHENAEATEEGFNLWNKWPTLPKNSKRKKFQKKMMFNCKYCLMGHDNHRSFIAHMNTDHSDKGQHTDFQCPYNCTTQVDSIKQLIMHFRSNHSEEYYGKTLKWDGTLTNKQGRPRQKCDECGKMFDIYYLSSHKLRYHSKNNIPKVKPKPEHIYSCPYPNCLTNCKSVQLLKFHFILHLENNPYACTFPGCKVKCDAACHLKRHMKLHFEAPPTCTKCGVSYSRSDKLRNHNCEANIGKQRVGEYGLVRVPSSTWRLQRDLKIVSKNEVTENGDDLKPPSDVSCSSTARLIKDGLNETTSKHVQSIQRCNINQIIKTDPVFLQACEDRPGFGDLLLGAFYTKKTKSTHQKIQPKTYSHKCTRCNTVFTGIHGYNAHNVHCTGNDDRDQIDLSNSNSTEVKMMQIGCPICGKSFADSDLVESHLSEDHDTEEIYKCEREGCGKVFPDEKSRERHSQRIHADRPYKCEQCDSSYISQHGFEQHLEQHRLNPNLGSTKAFSCEICKKILVNLSSLRRHMLGQHGIVKSPAVKPVKPKAKMKLITKAKKTITNSKSRIANVKKKPKRKTQWKSPKTEFNGNVVQRRSERQRVVKKFPDEFLDFDLDLPAKNEPNIGELQVQIKTEPELIIEPEAMEGNETDNFQEYDQVGKYEDEEHL